MTNPFFNFTKQENEESLLEGFEVESIQIYGQNILYLPKKLIDFSKLYGEDTQRAFLSNYTIETYPENNQGWGGDLNFLNEKGLNIEKQMVFTISKRRFDEVIIGFTFKGYWVSGTAYNLNDGVMYPDRNIYISQVAANTNTPGTDTTWKIMKQVRPDEGDLIYWPLTHDIMEVNFADFEQVFYQLGKIYIWKITCEKFVFSHEKINTGIPQIDSIARELLNNDSVRNDPLADNEVIDHKIEDFLNLDSNAPF